MRNDDAVLSVGKAQREYRLQVQFGTFTFDSLLGHLIQEEEIVFGEA